MARNRFAQADVAAEAMEAPSLVDAGKHAAAEERRAAEKVESGREDASVAAPAGEKRPAAGRERAEWTRLVGKQPEYEEPRNRRYNGAFRESDMRAWKECARANGISVTRLIELCVNDFVSNGREIPR